MRSSGRAMFRVVSVSTVVLPAACVRPTGPLRLAPLTAPEAIALVNQNADRFDGTWRAVGEADGTLRDHRGTSRTVHLDAALFYRPPRHLRFDLKAFGDRKLLLGSNDEWFWVYDGQQDAYTCGRYDHPDDWSDDLFIRPDQAVDALGLGRLPRHWLIDRAVRVVHRVLDDHQELLFVARDSQGRLFLEKEIWLDRFSPRLIRRVVFRNADGLTVLESRLGDYRVAVPGGPFLPYEWIIEWPQGETRFRFRVSRWKAAPDVGADGVQFALPGSCRAQ